MPTYDYECEKCGKTFTAFHSILAKPLSRCPLCKSGPVRRLIGPGAGLLFKGTGFYITDYKKKGSPKKDSDGGSGSPSPKSDSGSKSEGEKKDSGGGSSGSKSEGKEKK